FIFTIGNISYDTPVYFTLKIKSPGKTRTYNIKTRLGIKKITERVSSMKISNKKVVSLKQI
ncbi:hypothetical protein LDC_1386, partial [sediment metagenome]